MNEYPNYINIMIHMVGLDHKKPYIRHGKKFYKLYRNYFCTYQSDENLLELYHKGFASVGTVREYEVRQKKYNVLNFHLTREGLDHLGKFLVIKIYDED